MEYEYFFLWTAEILKKSFNLDHRTVYDPSDYLNLNLEKLNKKKKKMEQNKKYLNLNLFDLL